MATTTSTTSTPFSKLPTLDELKSSFSALDTDRLVGIVRDAAYVVVGFGVLTVQQLQAGYRSLVSTVEANPVVQQMGIDRGQIEEVVAQFEAQMSSMSERFDAFEAKLDTAFEQLEERLPQQAADALGQAHDIAKAARKQVRGLLRAV